ncbi:MAG TPA: hypothetical protein H9861_06965 [Candidatus Ligilactobacillus excrementigallinarum]|uniref:Uncharacterized protein n=1 Tax=Candidatus Ligilactobacillus excrementigallinarum TaxID=2838641 RepID=A0A9D1UY34_9LACO|nr:hypothetical protein [Candidatus Ligilactobacillus excrementigallinarum]
MRISIILIILLLIVVGFLMIYNSFGMRERDALVARSMIIILGILSLCGGIYLFVRYVSR